eukprot:CAMPEP_0202890252 /NCGR_PEP_ID=MMETSP1392-20130828/731_1 /ASSEMBLY_ACC=CAM_ASM_000868 /TAXON_ID=225041 /ORGANISM="Chlamydomonas chlamydogama, Strain SAG 11-48b" /LENGTH=152 /DNA_ID=CAMNT_0049573789 /DNA_START=30 /DNA_END=488 /DNA_ORIENTATION=+
MASSSRSTKQLLQRLIPSASQDLQHILRTQRDTFWGETELKFRVRKYKKSDEERVSIVKPQLHHVKLYSKALRRMVPLEMTKDMLRTIEARGGLDEYLRKTPDWRLKSNVASNLRWEVMCALQRASTPQAQGTTRAAAKAGAAAQQASQAGL